MKNTTNGLDRNMELRRLTKHCLLGIFLLLLPHLKAQAGDSPFLFFKDQQIESVKTAFQSDKPALIPYKKVLRKWADNLMNQGPWSVTDVPTKAVSSDPHDYYSEGPYWWPDPTDPDAPYIRKDGRRNPARFIAHKAALNKMYEAVTTLSLAGYLFDENRYSDRAAELIAVWFINEKTRMNPNLDYAQAIPNKSPGRGVGIIDTHRLPMLLEAFNMLDKTGRWDPSEKEKLKAWITEYLHWLTHSKNGKQEEHQGNNHSSWWCAQVAACAIYTGNAAQQEKAWNYYREFLVPTQMEPDGSFPEEQARTLSLSYSNFNLEAYSLICQTAMTQGIDLWHWQTKDGRGIEDALDYLLPFIKRPETWKLEQIKPFDNRDRYFLAFAGWALDNNSFLNTYGELKDAPEAMMQKSIPDVFTFLINMLVDLQDSSHK